MTMMWLSNTFEGPHVSRRNSEHQTTQARTFETWMQCDFEGKTCNQTQQWEWEQPHLTKTMDAKITPSIPYWILQSSHLTRKDLIRWRELYNSESQHLRANKRTPDSAMTGYSSYSNNDQAKEEVPQD